ncbi:MAG: transposase [Chitinispirillaceae bacterium]|nr:transposase [Chitinispirillaceae bacterium]
MWAVLKRGFYGTYHNFSTKHIRHYVNEFTFRCNEGRCRIPSMGRSCRCPVPGLNRKNLNV